MTTHDRKILKLFVLEEKNRSLLSFSDVDKIRLSPEENRVLLKKDTDGLYPVDDTDAYVTVWTTAPESWIAWVAFQATVVEKLDDDQADIVTYYYRLTDGTDEYHWNGASWDISTTLWNTEQEINEGLSTWTNNTIGIIVNPRTNDDEVTPEVLDVRLVYDANVNFLRDAQISFTELLKDQFRTWREHVFAAQTTASTFNLSSDNYKPELELTIADILAVYDHTADPNHTTNLLSSWSDPMLTLTGSVTAGNLVYVELEYVPQISFATDVDYIEVSKVPAIWIENFEISTVRGRMRDGVLRKDTNIAYQWENTRFGDILVTLSPQTSDPSDHLMVAGQIEEFFATVQQMRSLAIDELYDIEISETYDGRQGPDNKGQMSSRGRLRIRNVLLAATVVQRYGIERVNLDLVTG